MNHAQILAACLYVSPDSVRLADDLGLDPRWTYGKGCVRCRLHGPDGAVIAFVESSLRGEYGEREAEALDNAIDVYFALVGHDETPRRSDFWAIERE